MTGAKDSNLSTPNSETELEKRDLEQKQVEQRDEESGTLESDDNDADSTMIQEKKLGWQTVTALLLTEYVVLAILAFPSSFAILGMAGGTITTLALGGTTYWTTRQLWLYTMRYPRVRDIADVAQQMSGRRWVYWAALFGLIANNYAIMGLHSIAGATAIQTIRNTAADVPNTLAWAVIITALMFAGSLIREFKHLVALGLIASSTMFVCFLIVVIGHAVQGAPNGFATLGVAPSITVWSPPGTSFVDIVNAILNITYTWTGQALVPSFVADMRRPEDFDKALKLSMLAEFLLFTVCGAVVYHYTGSQYTTAPAYGSLVLKYGRVAAGFTLPTIICVGILYSLVTSRAIFFQIFGPGSRHRRTHTPLGWSVWTGIVLVGWIISFIIGQAVPFFFSLLALISALFDSWFGFIMWGAAYYALNRGSYFKGPRSILSTIVAASMIAIGFFFFTVGTYTAIESILISYSTGAIRKPFTTANTGYTFDA